MKKQLLITGLAAGLMLVLAACHAPVKPVDPAASNLDGGQDRDWKGAEGKTKRLPEADVLPHQTHTTAGHEIQPEVVTSGGETHLYYTSNATSPSNYNIYRMNASGGAAEMITSMRGDEHWPTVSPDGRYLAFGANNEGSWNIYVMSLENLSATPKRITAATGNHNIQPSWSPMGDAIVYASSAHDGKYMLKRVMLGGDRESMLDADSDGLSNALEGAAGLLATPSASFAELPGNTRPERMVPKGEDGYPMPTSYEELRTNQGEPVWGMHPSYNPGDPDQIVYQSFSQRGKRWSGLYTLRMSTGIVTVLPLPADHGAIQPSWAPALSVDGELQPSRNVVYTTVGRNPQRKDKKEPVGGDGFAIISLDGRSVRAIANPLGDSTVNDPVWVNTMGDGVIFFSHAGGIASVVVNPGR